MKIFVIKNNKIIRQENEGYQAKNNEIILRSNEIDYPIKKRTGGQFFEIHKDDKQENDIIQGGVTKFKVKRIVDDIEKILIIERSEKLETDELLEFIYPENMIRVYRGGTSVYTIGTDFDSNTEAIEHKYTKDELFYDGKNIKIKTPEMQIKDIQIKAEEKLSKLKDDLEKLENKKEKRILVNDWYKYNEEELISLQNLVVQAEIDYNNAKQELLNNADSIENIEIAKKNIKPMLIKYDIKV